MIISTCVPSKGIPPFGGFPKNDLIQARYAKELNLRKSHMAAVKAGLIRDSKAKCSKLQTQYEEAEAAVLSEQQLLNHLTGKYAQYAGRKFSVYS